MALAGFGMIFLFLAVYGLRAKSAHDSVRDSSTIPVAEPE
jgi:hypothetical protein